MRTRYENFEKIKRILRELGTIGNDKFIQFNQMEIPTKKMLRNLNFLMKRQRALIDENRGK